MSELPKRTAAELEQALRERARYLDGQPWHMPATKAMMVEAADELVALRSQVETLKAELARERQAHSQTIDERDRAQESADRLAYAIAPEDVIGEHSNCNDPWLNAVNALDAEREQHAYALGRMQMSFSAEEERADALQAAVREVRAELEKIVDDIAAVPQPEFCYCGHPRKAHKFYDDKIYDVQELRCPSGFAEFRLDIARSKAEQRRQRIELLDTVLAGLDRQGTEET